MIGFKNYSKNQQHLKWEYYERDAEQEGLYHQ